MPNLVANEQTKLLAGSLDRLSTVCVTVDFAAPVANLLYNSDRVPYSIMIWSCYLWLTVAGLFHVLANIVLERLEP